MFSHLIPGGGSTADQWFAIGLFSILGVVIAVTLLGKVLDWRDKRLLEERRTKAHRDQLRWEKRKR